MTATELAERLPVSRQAVMKHLDLLRTAGLVASEKDGRAVRYVLRAEPLDDAAAWMAQRRGGMGSTAGCPVGSGRTQSNGRR